MSEQLVKEIDGEIENQKAALPTFQTLERLKANPDFIRIISTGYFVEFPAKQLELRSSEDYQKNPVAMARIEQSLAGVSALHSYLNSITAQGHEALMQIEALNEYRDRVVDGEIE